jgi:hypothetical protein
MEPKELYGLPLERFTEERNALVKELRKEGRGEEAAEVSNLRKPSVAAWAVNQLVRTQMRDVANMFEAGDVLRETQSQLLAGRGEADALRNAVEAERAAVDQLTHRARGLLSSEGHELTSATLERVSETLNAAALDEDLRAQVSEGCLVRELHHVGLGVLGAPDRSRPGARSGARSKSRSKKRAVRAHEKRPERKQTRSPQAAQVRKAEAEARRRAERTARELRTAQSRRDRAADEFRRTKEALRNAEAAVAAAQEAAAGAIREMEELRRTRDRG